MKNQNVRKCGDCIHEFACQMWNSGSLHDTDARSCINYETVKDCNAYLIGFMDGKKDSSAYVTGESNE